MAAKSENQRIKLLKLYEILQKETDEAHPLTTNKLCEKLADLNISCDRRTLYKDIAYLNDNGYEIMRERVGHDMGYYIYDRKLDNHEIRILIDAVRSSTFIPEKETMDFVQKLAHLSSDSAAEILAGDIVDFNTKKHSNKRVFYSVDSAETAIVEDKKVYFTYFDLNWKKEAIARKNGDKYILDPLTLVFRDNNYYLVCYNTKYKDINNYRVDRMADVEALEHEISDEAKQLKGTEELRRHIDTSVGMYSGESADVVLEFKEKLLNPVYDSFGEDIIVSPSAEPYFRATINVQISAMFFAWVSRFEGEIKIIAPSDTIEKYKEFLTKNSGFFTDKD